MPLYAATLLLRKLSVQVCLRPSPCHCAAHVLPPSIECSERAPIFPRSGLGFPRICSRRDAMTAVFPEGPEYGVADELVPADGVRIGGLAGGAEVSVRGPSVMSSGSLTSAPGMPYSCKERGRGRAIATLR